MSDLTLRFTKHAEEKLRVRNIDTEKVREVLDTSQHVFYDTLRSTEVAVGGVTLKGKASTLVIIYTKQDNAYYIITAYPTRGFEEKMRRKVKSGRWVTVKG